MGVQNRYEVSGKWWKGNLHMHSTHSDGAMSYEELQRDYGGKYGYDFLAMTDHDHLADASKLSTRDFLFLDGLEFGGSELGESFHAVAIDVQKQLPAETAFPDMVKGYAEQGAILMAAHPFWCGNTPQVFAQQTLYTCIEVYNALAEGICGRGLAIVHWDYALRQGVKVWGTAVDDAHLGDDRWPNSGWVCVKAEELTAQAILSAVRRGEFYASNGPEIKSITVTGDALEVKTSRAWRIRLVDVLSGACQKGYAADMGAEHIAGATFDIAAYESGENGGNVRIEVESLDHRCAWTNPVFVKE